MTVINIQTLEIIRGELPRSVAMPVKECAMHHRNKLMEGWKLCEQLQTPNKIAPLE